MKGDADLAAADTLSKALLPVIASKPSRVILDLAALTFISSLFVGQLVTLRRGLSSHGGKVIIAGAQERVLKVIRHAQVDSLFEIVAEAPRAAQE